MTLLSFHSLCYQDWKAFHAERRNFRCRRVDSAVVSLAFVWLHRGDGEPDYLRWFLRQPEIASALHVVLDYITNQRSFAKRLLWWWRKMKHHKNCCINYFQLFSFFRLPSRKTKPFLPRWQCMRSLRCSWIIIQHSPMFSFEIKPPSEEWVWHRFLASLSTRSSAEACVSSSPGHSSRIEIKWR